MCGGRIGIYSISEKKAIKADAQTYLDAKAQYGTLKEFYKANPDFKTKSGYGLSTAYQTNRVLQGNANKIVPIKRADGSYAMTNYNGRQMLHARVYKNNAPKNATTIPNKEMRNMSKSAQKIADMERKSNERIAAALNKNSSNTSRSRNSSNTSRSNSNRSSLKNYNKIRKSLKNKNKNKRGRFGRR